MASRTIAFFPEGAFGPTNNCVGIGDVLRRRGHRVVFIVEESFAGTLEAQGFEERLMRLTPKPEVEEVPGQFWKDFIRETAPVFRRPTIEQLEGFIAPTFQALRSTAPSTSTSGCVEIIGELEPDIVVEDNIVRLPGAARVRAAVGADRLLQPGRAEGPRRAAHLLGPARGRPLGLGRLLGGLPRRPRRDARRLQRLLRRARRAAAARATSSSTRART